MQHPLEAYLHDQIEMHGPMPFDRFMEAALYHPEWGYYETETTVIGREGDFQTSVSTGPFFGELLARRFMSWLENGKPCQWMECGAHHGQLAQDILEFLSEQQAPNNLDIEYLIFEPSEKRETIQRERLKQFGNRVKWLRNWEGVEKQFTNGVIFSNELIDAFPVKRFIWNQGETCWQELAVTTTKGGFTWTQLPLKSPMEIPWLSSMDRSKLEQILPDQYVIELAPTADDWWKQAAQALKKGYLITLDYGFTEMDKFSPHRTEGTLRTYDRHRLGEDVLADIGRKDMTAHVDFPSLQMIGEKEGLQTESMITQEKFMHGCLEIALEQGLQPLPDQIRQFQTLMHPEHFGRAFKVLIQKRSNHQGSAGLPR